MAPSDLVGHLHIGDFDYVQHTFFIRCGRLEVSWTGLPPTYGIACERPRGRQRRRR
jgi:hypothetical protein